MKTEADVIVVGSGAGGATVARELARAGRDVIVLERGAWHRRFLGTHVGAARMADRMGMRFSREGLQCVRGLTAGGSTMFACGTYRAPAPFIREQLGIDLSDEIREVRDELGVARLPERLLGGSSLRLLEAANALGYHWEIFEKFVDAEKCREGCSDCMLGCPRGAKWTSRRYLDEAIEAGATFVPRARVERVVHTNGRAEGVDARVGSPGVRRAVSFRAPLVIVAAGGMGSAPILRRSGVEGAGEGIFVDPLTVVCGTYKGPDRRAGTRFDPPMSVGTWEFYDEGFMLAPLIDPWLLFGLQMALVSPRKIGKLLRYRRTMAIMVKIGDDLDGAVYEDGSFSKPLTDADRRKLGRGAEISREVLAKAGCDPKSFVETPVRGAHPGGACRIGVVVDENLRTAVEGLYVADASVFPRALGTPVVATAAAMSKRLARHLLGSRPKVA